MKSQFLGAMLCLAVTCTTLAQKSPIKFGEVSLEDFKMTRYEKDSSAAAVVLCDFGESSINYSAKHWIFVEFSTNNPHKNLKKGWLGPG